MHLLMADSSNETHHAATLALVIAVLLAVLVPHLMKRHGLKLFGNWALGLAIAASLLYLLYELAMPRGMIRLDVILVWPVMLVIWINAVLNYRRQRRKC